MAARAGVSPGTVSNVLTGRRRVDPALAERVRAAVEDLGYMRHAAASLLRSSRTTVIGAVVPDLPDTFCATFVGKIEELARAHGYRTLVAGSGEDPEEELAQVQALAAWRPAGVLIIPTDDRFRAGQFLAAAGIPVVAVDRVTDAMPVDSIGIDNAAEAGRAAAHLADLGHKRVLVVASSLALNNISQRAAGACSALAGRAAVEVVQGIEGEPYGPAIAEAVSQRLGRRPLPTALLALTGHATLGAVLALQQRGLVVPRDVSLIGFDDNEWMKIDAPGHQRRPPAGGGPRPERLGPAGIAAAWRAHAPRARPAGVQPGTAGIRRRARPAAPGQVADPVVGRLRRASPAGPRAGRLVRGLPGRFRRSMGAAAPAGPNVLAVGRPSSVVFFKTF